jgi:probable rRNA maturation factor
VVVEGNDQTVDGVDDVEHWCEVARGTLLGEGVIAGRLDLLFVDRAEMADLNQTHLGQPGPTDVLAFPLDGPPVADEPAGVPATGLAPGSPDGEPPCLLGDVVVCPSVAREQASDHSGSFRSELTLLIIHGVLHVLGHDHAEASETRIMQGRERHHLGRYGLRHPVVA